MYLQITTRCNMSCQHCGFACTARGHDIKLSVARKAIDLYADYDCCMVIGGGEPTLHPRFWDILMYGLQYTDIWLATNGKIKSKALTLARLAQRGILGCALSRDSYHEEISPDVVQAFTKVKNNYSSHSSADDRDQREIRGVNTLVKQGRCTSGESICMCPDMLITPDGYVKACGCLGSPVLGRVGDEILYSDGYESYECWYDQDKSEQKATLELNAKNR
jgi:MoaA/NifB/PqqE/SkfB family radical SAM enzyme